MYCWTYANRWSELAPQVEGIGAVGPIFVSVGNAEKLKGFLELNPNIPKDRIFVDRIENDFQGYQSLGFTQFGLDDIRQHWRTVEFPPRLSSIKQGWQYLTSIPSIGPFKNNDYSRVPEGGLVMGGTFVLADNAIVYEWRDKLPGDLPEPPSVLTELERVTQSNTT